MKLFVASDIHGSYYYCKKLFTFFNEMHGDKMLLLGDLLYHGPRNDLPREYNPKQCIELYNSYQEKIIAVRGNCDSEVDQMVLNFPIMADSVTLDIDNLKVIASHGHIYNKEHMPMDEDNYVFFYGHTHIPEFETLNGNLVINPGSISIPKMNSKHSFGILEDRIFTMYSLDGEQLAKYPIDL